VGLSILSYRITAAFLLCILALNLPFFWPIFTTLSSYFLVICMCYASSILLPQGEQERSYAFRIYYKTIGILY